MGNERSNTQQQRSGQQERAGQKECEELRRKETSSPAKRCSEARVEDIIIVFCLLQEEKEEKKVRQSLEVKKAFGS